MFYQMTRFLLNCSTGYPDSIVPYETSEVFGRNSEVGQI